MKRKAIVVTIIIILLLAAFFAFFILKQQAIANQKKYPTSTDCDSIADMFGGNYKDATFNKVA
jgi:hypothetical protein